MRGLPALPPHQALDVAPQSCWLAAGGSPLGLNSKRMAHGTPRWMQLWRLRPGPESATAGVVAAGRGARALVPYTFLPSSKGTGICWLACPAASRLVASRQARRCGPAGPALTVQLRRTYLCGVYWPRRSCAGPIRPGHISLARPKEARPPQSRPLFAQGSIALPTKANRQAVASLQQGLKFDGKNAGAYFDLGQRPPCC